MMTRGSSIGAKTAWAGTYLPLGAILLTGLALRTYGIDFGLPLHFHIDETRVMDRVIRMVTSGDPNPHFFHYPSFIFYLLSGLTAAYYGVQYLVFAIVSAAHGEFPSFGFFRSGFSADVSTLYLLGRLSMALFGVLTVLLVYFLARELFSKRAALFAALAVALVPLHVLESHYIKQEVPMTFFMLLALLIGVVGTRASWKWTSCGVGLVSGVAASVKYNGLLALAIVPLLFRRGGKLTSASFFGRGPAKIFLVALLGFLAFSPFVVLDFSQFRTDFAYETLHVAEKGHHGFDLNGDGVVYHRFLYQLLAAFPFSLGIPLYLAGLAGTCLALAKRENGLLWILFFALPYFIAVSLMKVVFLRYYMPLVVVLCIMAGYFFDALMSSGGVRSRSLAGLCALFVFAWTLAFTFSLERHMPRGRSSFDDALAWLSENAQPGEKIAFTHFTPPLSPGTYTLVHMRPQHFAKEWLAQESPDAIMASKLVTVGFERGGEGMGEGREFLADLRGGRLGYLPAARFERDFLSKRFFERIDPTLSETFMPGIEIFVKDNPQ